MAERVEDAESEGAGEAGVPPLSPAAAMAIGMRKGRAGAKPDPVLDTFLERQTRLTELQTEHLHEQRELMLSRLRWGRFSDRMKAVLQVMTAVVGLGVVAGEVRHQLDLAGRRLAQRSFDGPLGAQPSA